MAEPNISHSMAMNAAAVRTIQKEVAQENAMQVDSEENLTQYFDTVAFNPMQRASNFKELHELKSSLSQKKGGADETEEAEELTIQETEQIEEAASRFQKNNNELRTKTLLILREQISAKDSPEDALKKILKVYADPSLADEALDFLIETADAKTIAILKEAKKQLNDTFGREIRAGRNMGIQAREFSEAGLGSPTSLRDMYRDITGNPRHPVNLFNELSEKFNFEKIKSVIHFMLHSLGSDIRAKGPSIPRGELKVLIDEIRSLQGMLGVYRFFQSQMAMIHRQFSSYDLECPPRVTFELLAKLLIRLLAERFVNPEKILQTAKLLGVEEEVAGQIILFTQMRNGLKQIAPRYFRNAAHREQLWKTYIDVIEDLEDKLEEEEEGEQNNKKEETDS